MFGDSGDNSGSSDFNWVTAIIALVMFLLGIGLIVLLAGLLIFGIIKLNIFLCKYKAGRVFVILSWLFILAIGITAAVNPSVLSFLVF